MEGGMLAMFMQSILALSFVLGLFALVVWAVRRFQGHSNDAVQRDFKIIQRIHLDNKNSIVEIRHKGQHYLLGLSPGGMVQLKNESAISSRDVKHEQ